MKTRKIKVSKGDNPSVQMSTCTGCHSRESNLISEILQQPVINRFKKSIRNGYFFPFSIVETET